MLSRRALLAAALQDVTFTSKVDVVNLLATVRDKRGQLVTGLTADDFELREDGRPQRIQYFAQQSDLPLRLGLLVDTSISQEKVLPAQKGAAYRFLDQVLREKTDLCFLIQFETLARVRLGFSNSREQLETTLAGMDTPTRREMRAGSGTALFDAIASGAELMKTQTGRKALIVMSDGVDTSSDFRVNMAVEEALRADCLVYALYFFDPAFYFAGMPDGKAILSRLAQQTGGTLYELSKKLSPEQAFAALEGELRSQYSLGYVSDAKPGYPAFRKIRLTARKAGLTVGTRAGYWPR